MNESNIDNMGMGEVPGITDDNRCVGWVAMVWGDIAIEGFIWPSMSKGVVVPEGLWANDTGRVRARVEKLARETKVPWMEIELNRDRDAVERLTRRMQGVD